MWICIAFPHNKSIYPSVYRNVSYFLLASSDIKILSGERHPTHQPRCLKILLVPRYFMFQKSSDISHCKIIRYEIMWPPAVIYKSVCKIKNTTLACKYESSVYSLNIQYSDYAMIMHRNALCSARWRQCKSRALACDCVYCCPGSKVNRANMGPTEVLSTPDGLHVGPMNLAIRVVMKHIYHQAIPEWLPVLSLFPRSRQMNIAPVNIHVRVPPHGVFVVIRYACVGESIFTPFNLSNRITGKREEDIGVV